MMYYDICCEQEERRKLVVEVERADEGKRNLEYQLENCRKEIERLHQQNQKEMSDHLVSECGLTPFQSNHLFLSPYS
jgi:predicted  nucleic acid-binding Zn-ribbon protein